MSEPDVLLHSRRGNGLSRAARATALFGGVLMLLAGVLIILSIATRWLLSASIPGDVELIQSATAVAAFSFLPLGQISRSTIVVDTFTARLPPRWRDRIDAFWDSLYAVIALILAWRLAIGAVDAVRSHTASTVIGLPVGWMMLIGTVMLLLVGATAFATAGRLLRGAS
jgi:TRAP-type C4-dicarboxylate transport system permease small subunit